MIEIKSFSNMYESFKFIKDKNIDENSFSFEDLPVLRCVWWEGEVLLVRDSRLWGDLTAESGGRC